MERLIHEDTPRYDLRYKVILITMPAFTFAVGILAYVDGYCYNLSKSVLESETKVVAVVLLATTAIVEALYWALLPKRFSIFSDRVEIKSSMG